MVRDGWVNLNGLWDYAIQDKEADRPASWDGQILVPFAAESALSGVMKPVKPEQRLWYRRTFETPDVKAGERVLLHFGAVDWDTHHLGQRHASRHASRRLRSVHLRHHGSIEAGRQRIGAVRLGSHRCRLSAAGQAGPQARRHHVHGRHRHLADRLAGNGTRRLRPVAEDRPGHRSGCGLGDRQRDAKPPAFSCRPSTAIRWSPRRQARRGRPSN